MNANFRENLEFHSEMKLPDVLIKAIFQNENRKQMKTMIAYSTTHGCTHKISEQMSKYLDGEVQLVNLKKESSPDLSNFERVIIGGSIHAGQIQKRVKEFCHQYFVELQKKELGLFTTCMETGEIAQKQLMNAYPEELFNKAKITAYFGGEFDFKRMNFFEKMIVKKVANVKESTSHVDLESVRKFSRRMDRVFNPFLFLA